jgi:hypothetical protein
MMITRKGRKLPSRDLELAYLSASFTHECCTAAEETIMLKLTLILAVLGVPIGLGTYEANDNDRCRALSVA